MLMGIKPPAYGVGGQFFELPAPGKGGREEKFTPVRKVWENVFGDLIPGERAYRFEGVYRWPKMDADIADAFIDAMNSGAIVRWVPHSDFPFIGWNCLVDNVSPLKVGGLVGVEGLEVKLRSVKLIPRIPTIDNMIQGVRLTKAISWR